MGTLTKNLSRAEFACQCGCGLSEPHPMLVAGIQEMTDRLAPMYSPKVIVRSGSRCQAHNDKPKAKGGAGGSPGSQHCPQEVADWYTLASDLSFPGVDMDDVLKHALLTRRFELGGIGLYLDSRPGGVDRVHVDVRLWTARWGWLNGKSVTWATAVSELDRRRI